MRILPCGEHALLLDLDDGEAALGLQQAICDAKLPGIVDVVPAEHTVLISVAPGTTRLSQLAEQISALEPVRASTTSCREVEIPVVYDGPDLLRVCEMAGMSEEALVDCHLRQIWTVAFAGFAPGFGYMTANAWTHVIPRHSESRLEVRAGAIGLAGRYCGVYPSDSPGGWQIIGHTTLAVWCPKRNPPAVLRPGTRVRFVRTC
jgi:KipI family sensor histidine kinase inhibitor